jgi:hypothetical protein
MLSLYERGFEGGWLPSTVYRYDILLKALQLMYLEGVGQYKIYLREDVAGVEGVLSTASPYHSPFTLHNGNARIARA